MRSAMECMPLRDRVNAFHDRVNAFHDGVNALHAGVSALHDEINEQRSDEGMSRSHAGKLRARRSLTGRTADRAPRSRESRLGWKTGAVTPFLEVGMSGTSGTPSLTLLVI
jgi:hypothetical protein